MVRSLLVLTFAALLPTALAGCFDGARLALGYPEYTSRAGTDEVIMLPMRDGTRLKTEIFYPEGEGPWPVVLIRNPYNFTGGFGYVAKLFSHYGYVGVHQLARGRADSEGAWYPFLNERNDGEDTLTWLVDQAWQDGNVGMFGASYLSLVQWAVADRLPPEVKTLVPMVWGSDVRGIAYEGGMFRHDLVTMWAALMHDETLDMFNMGNYKSAIAHRPHAEVDRKFFDANLAWYRDWISAQHGDAPVWKLPEVDLLKQIPQNTKVPVLTVGAWYDIFINSQIDDYLRLGSRNKSRLIVGPWTHLLGMSGDGIKPFPGAGDGSQLFGRVLNWFDHHLKGKPLDNWGPIETYAIGEGRWQTWADYPPATKPLRLYLADAEKSQRCSGGDLLGFPPRKAETISYVYTPESPVPTRGGSGMLSFAVPGWAAALPSNRDQHGLCDRLDVLSFQSPPMEKPLPIKGRIKIVLNVSSTANDTAFTAKLIEVAPDGRAVNIRDTITSLAYRNGATLPVDYRPGTTERVELTMWPIEWTVQPGYRLRLDVSSSNFPAYHVHSNYAGPWASQKETRNARQTVSYTKERPAYLELPVYQPHADQKSPAFRKPNSAELAGGKHR